MNPTDIEEMNISEVNGADFIQVNNSRTHISKKLRLISLLRDMTPSTEHCGFTLKDVNYVKSYVLFEKNDHSEQVKFSFEFIQDVARYTTGEWDWRQLHPKNKFLERIVNGINK